jgi:hypothetical protein
MAPRPTGINRHATFTIAGYTIPLIGIDPSETMDYCDGCKPKKIFNIQMLAWVMTPKGNVLLCETCQRKRKDSTCKNKHSGHSQ